MYKVRNKKLAILLTVVFVLTIMLPLAGPASAATSYSALGAPSVTDAPGQNLGALFIKIDPMAAGETASAIISLPTDIDLTPGLPITPTISSASGTPALTPAVDQPGTAPFGVNEFQIYIDNSAVGSVTEKVEVTIPLPNVTVAPGFSGDITAKIIGVSGQLSSGEVVVGVVPSGAVEVTSSGPDFLADGNTVTFTITENTAGALSTGASLKFTLPKGFSWATGAGPNVLAGNFDATTTSTVSITGTNNRALQLNVPAIEQSTVKSVIRVSGTVSIDEFEAKYGDVEVSLGGTSSSSPSKLVVSEYTDFGVEASVKDAPDILAGRFDVEIGDVVIDETAPGSLVGARTILLTLPKGAEWQDAGTLDTTHVTAGNVITNNNRTNRITVGAPSTTKAGKIVLEGATVNTAVNFRGDLTAEVTGSAGVTGDLVVANVVAPIAATADKPNVKIGVQAQAAGDITITEAEAETLKRNEDLVITSVLGGVTFNATPQVEVIEGDIEVSVKKANNSNDLVLRIDAESSKAATIKISGITLTVNRSFPEGEVEMAFSGEAVDEVNDFAVVGAAAPLFDRDRTAATVVNATCVTPAPGEEKQDATFVIGSTTYTVNGVEAAMDVAPYVKEGRTYLPVRYVGYALGVAEDNIFWDGQTATLMKGDKVVQVTVGSKAMVVNGATINMDVTPELTNDRTMLPFRWIAMAFGANVDWNQDTQTVTMEL